MRPKATLIVVICLVAAFLPLISNADDSTKQKNMVQKTHTTPPTGDAALRARAEKLHRDSIVVDTHNDITSPMLDLGFDIGTNGDDPNGKVKTHTDLRRM